MSAPEGGVLHCTCIDTNEVGIFEVLALLTHSPMPTTLMLRFELQPATQLTGLTVTVWSTKQPFAPLNKRTMYVPPILGTPDNMVAGKAKGIAVAVPVVVGPS